jgi:hypothetical protein
MTKLNLSASTLTLSTLLTVIATATWAQVSPVDTVSLEVYSGPSGITASPQYSVQVTQNDVSYRFLRLSESESRVLPRRSAYRNKDILDA